MILFGIAELILSQLPNFHKLSVLSVVAAIMSFGYSFIGIGLSVAQIVGQFSRPSLHFTLAKEM